MAPRLPLPALFAAYPAEARSPAAIRLASAAIDFRSGLSFCWEWQCPEGKSATRLLNGKLRRLARERHGVVIERRHNNKAKGTHALDQPAAQGTRTDLRNRMGDFK
jgi:hypothetical protein